MKRFWTYPVLALLFILPSSCGPGSYLIKEEPKLKPSEGKALVNFIRPRYLWGPGTTATIWDSDKLIIISEHGKHSFQYECEPGKHLFISWSEYKSPVEAELLPNRIYYIVLRRRMGFVRLRIHQVPVSKEHPLWEDALMWQDVLPNYTCDQETLAAVEAKSKKKILAYLEKYEHEIKGTKHVLYLRAEDGVPPQ